MTDDVNSKSSAALPEDVLRPKKPRAKKTAATEKIESQKEPPAPRSERTASAKPRKTAKGQTTSPAPKQPAKKRTATKQAATRQDSPRPASTRQPAEDLPPEGAGGFNPRKQAERSEGFSRGPKASILPASAASKAAPKKKSLSRRKSKATEEVAAPPLQITSSLIEDPIGDVSDGEARIYTGELPDTDAASEVEAYRAGVASDAIDGTLEAPGEFHGQAQPQPAESAQAHAKKRAPDEQAAARPPAKLERLQKILSRAGIASRRHAEEMIVEGRVAVNGQVVTALGSKADPEHDHIRVDGKLLHGAERHRYFVLNKPKAYVTTVSDPQGRPTVMEFVSKLGERVYPVGRLDFQSEGLLLMTNDGALANQLTRASAGVEKTYLVKISGQPDEEELERLRNGVMIERGGPSDSGLYGPGGRVRTAPARIRQIRPGENPWYEVVLTEGRNREIRKMFSAIGHYVEKIRRVGYGPLVLDVEPGQLRELSIEEVDLLRQASEGKLRPRRFKTEAMIPKEAGRAADSRPEKRGRWRPSDERPSRPQFKGRPERAGSGDFSRHEEQKQGRGNEFRQREEPKPDRGNEFRPRREPKRGGDEFRPRREEGFASRGGSQRKFHGQRREWQSRPRANRPPRAGSGIGSPADSPIGFSDALRQAFPRSRETRTAKPAFGKPDFRRRNEAPSGKSDFPRSGEAQAGKPRFQRRSETRTGKPDFPRRGEARTGKPSFPRRNEGKFQKPEDREFRNRPDRPGARWQSGPAQRPFRPESRTAPASGGQSRPDAPAKFAPKGRFANRYPERSKSDFRLGKPEPRRGKPEVGGREHSTGEQSRDRNRFSSTRKPGNFRTGPRLSGPRSSGPRPGGKRRG